jgi:hypothetical protein
MRLENRAPGSISTGEVRQEKIGPGRNAQSLAEWLLRQEKAMTDALVATFKNVRTITNVEDDLLSTGIPSEKIKVDREHRKIRVMVPDATRAEVLEILNRHEPAEVH